MNSDSDPKGLALPLLIEEKKQKNNLDERYSKLLFAASRLGALQAEEMYLKQKKLTMVGAATLNVPEQQIWEQSAETEIIRNNNMQRNVSLPFALSASVTPKKDDDKSEKKLLEKKIAGYKQKHSEQCREIVLIKQALEYAKSKRQIDSTEDLKKTDTLETPISAIEYEIAKITEFDVEYKEKAQNYLTTLYSAELSCLPLPEILDSDPQLQEMIRLRLELKSATRACNAFPQKFLNLEQEYSYSIDTEDFPESEMADMRTARSFNLAHIITLRASVVDLKTEIQKKHGAKFDVNDRVQSVLYAHPSYNEHNIDLFFRAKDDLGATLRIAKDRDLYILTTYGLFFGFGICAMVFGGIYADDLIQDFAEDSNYGFLGLFFLIILPAVLLSAKNNQISWRRLYACGRELVSRVDEGNLKYKPLLLDLLGFAILLQVIAPAALNTASIAYSKLDDRNWRDFPEFFYSCSLISALMTNGKFLWDWFNTSVKRGIHQLWAGITRNELSRRRILIDERLNQLVRDVNHLAENKPFRFIIFVHKLFRLSGLNVTTLAALQKIPPETILAAIAVAFPEELAGNQSAELKCVTQNLCVLAALFYSALLLNIGKSTLPDFAEVQPQLVNAFSLLLSFFPLTVFRLQISALCSVLANFTINREAVSEVVLVFKRWSKTRHFDTALFIKAFLALGVGIYEAADAWRAPLLVHPLAKTMQAVLAFFGGSMLAYFSLRGARVNTFDFTKMLDYLDNFARDFASFIKDPGVTLETLDVELKRSADFRPAVNYFRHILIEILLPNVRKYVLQIYPNGEQISDLISNSEIKKFTPKPKEQKQKEKQRGCWSSLFGLCRPNQQVETDGAPGELSGVSINMSSSPAISARSRSLSASAMLEFNRGGDSRQPSNPESTEQLSFT